MLTARRKILEIGHSAFGLDLCVIGYNRKRVALTGRDRSVVIRHSQDA